MGQDEILEIIQTAANEAAKKAIQEHVKAQKKKEKQRVLRNTRLLLNHYTELKSHINCAKYRVEDIVEVKFDGDRIDIKKLNGDDVQIESIKRSVMVTKIMMGHVDEGLHLLKQKACKDKYQVLLKLYIEPYDMEWMERIKKLSEDLHISEATVRRWENEMVNDLCVLLFGVDGLKVF